MNRKEFLECVKENFTGRLEKRPVWSMFEALYQLLESINDAYEEEREDSTGQPCTCPKEVVGPCAWTCARHGRMAVEEGVVWVIPGRALRGT